MRADQHLSYLDWMDSSTELFLGAVDHLTDADFDTPTNLPGWTRRHVIAHVHFNAEALGRLAGWAATGVESHMYASVEQRGSDIERGALLPTSELRTMVHRSADELRSLLSGLSVTGWQHQVITAQGRTIAATEIPFMRVREVAIHAIDLGAGVAFDDLPSELLRALVDDVITKRFGGGQGPLLAAWLTGRDTAPSIGPWL
jgi:uncharacterized protein (TIGR03083 family)